MASKKTGFWEYVSLIVVISILLFSFYLIYRFYIAYTANQFDSPTYTTQLASIIIFGHALPPFILPQSIQGVNTESNAYATIINNILIIAGALLGFYSLVAIEVIKVIMSYIAGFRKSHSSHTHTNTVQARVLINVLLVFFLIATIYVILFISIIDASHAAVYQGIVSTAACQIATTIEQSNMALHNVTYAEIDCQGIPTPLYVGHSSQALNLSISTQLQGETMEITRYESLLFSDTKNAGNMLEAAIFLLSMLIITYAITLFLKPLQTVK